LNYNCIALHFACDRENIEFVSLLLEHGANVNVQVLLALLSFGLKYLQKDNLGQTSLHYACTNGNKQIIALLLKNGGDQGIKDIEELTPLDILNQNKES
jgi:ankyrin repeat protein